MADVLHDGMHCAGKADLVLVVHGDADEQLGLSCSLANVLTQFVALVHEVVRVACDGSVSHVCKLDLVSPGQKAVQDGGNFTLQNQLAIDQCSVLRQGSEVFH